MTGDGDDGARDAVAVAAPAPVQARPLNAVALAKEVVLEQLQHMLEWLLRRLKGYRAGRLDWWEK